MQLDWSWRAGAALVPDQENGGRLADGCMWGPQHTCPPNSTHASHVAPLLTLLATRQFHILLSIMDSELLPACTNSFVPTVGVHRKCCILAAQQEPDSSMRKVWGFFCQEEAPVLPSELHE